MLFAFGSRRGDFVWGGYSGLFYKEKSKGAMLFTGLLWLFAFGSLSCDFAPRRLAELVYIILLIPLLLLIS